MIRTDLVKLTKITASAYRQKLPSGGSGLVILSADSEQPGIASISKTSGDPIVTANTPADIYPIEAFREAAALTSGLPYKKQGKARVKNAPEDTKDTELKEEEVVVSSADYKSIVAEYTDKNGKLSYDLINRSLIKFGNSSSVVRSMIADGKSVDEIRLYAVGTKFRTISKNHDLTDAQVQKIADLLDEVSPRGVFREFNDYLRMKLAENKK